MNPYSSKPSVFTIASSSYPNFLARHSYLHNLHFFLFVIRLMFGVCVCIYIYRYFVVAEGIACGYTLVALILSSRSLLWRLIIILDAVIEKFQQFDFNFLGLLIVSCCIGLSGYDSGANFKHIGRIGNSSCREERQQSCWLATYLWTSSKVLWPCHWSSCLWFCRRICLRIASCFFSLFCPRSCIWCKTFRRFPTLAYADFVHVLNALIFLL